MDYSCPNCGINLKNRIVHSKWTGEKKKRLLWIRLPRASACPECGHLLRLTHSEENERFMRYLLWPLMLGIVALISNNTALRIGAVTIFFAGVIYVGARISRSSYKDRPYYSKYDEKP